MVEVQIDKQQLNSLIKDLEKLNMSDSKNKTLLRQGMRKAAKPILQELKNIVPVESKQLRKSLAVINVKTERELLLVFLLVLELKNHLLLWIKVDFISIF